MDFKNFGSNVYRKEEQSSRCIPNGKHWSPMKSLDINCSTFKDAPILRKSSFGFTSVKN